MAIPDRIHLAGSPQLLQSKGSDRLQRTVPAFPVPTLSLKQYERLIDQSGEQVQHVLRRERNWNVGGRSLAGSRPGNRLGKQPVVRADGLRRLERPPAGE